MSDQLLSSKMVVQEEDSGVRGIAGAPTTVCGAIGITERGPIGKAVRCVGLPDFQKRFGRILPSSDVSQAAMGFFLNAGGNGVSGASVLISFVLLSVSFDGRYIAYRSQATDLIDSFGGTLGLNQIVLV